MGGIDIQENTNQIDWDCLKFHKVT